MHHEYIPYTHCQRIFISLSAVTRESSHEAVGRGGGNATDARYICTDVSIFTWRAIERRASGAHHRPMKNPAFPDERRYLCVPPRDDAADPVTRDAAFGRHRGILYRPPRINLYGFSDGSMQTCIHFTMILWATGDRGRVFCGGTATRISVRPRRDAKRFSRDSDFANFKILLYPVGRDKGEKMHSQVRPLKMLGFGFGTSVSWKMLFWSSLLWFTWNLLRRIYVSVLSTCIINQRNNNILNTVLKLLNTLIFNTLQQLNHLWF